MRTIRNGSCCVLGVAFAAVLLPAGTSRGEAAADPAQIAAILDYVAVDYGAAVGEHGVSDPAELREQQGFLAEALDLARALPADERRTLVPPLQAALSAARTGAPADRVVPQTTRALEELRRRHALPRSPREAPSLVRGQALYAVGCTACHAEDGSGHTDAQLSTRPPDMHDPAQAGRLSPFRIFNAISYGVPGTAMPSYQEAWSEPQRWDLAFYFMSLAHPATGARSALPAPSLAHLASSSDDDLRRELSAARLAPAAVEETLSGWREAVPVPAAGSLEGCRRAISEAARLYRAGSQSDARRLAISGYLDEFEPHEAALRVRDAPLVSELEQAFEALRAGIETGLPASDVAALAARIEALLDEAEALQSRGGGGVSFAAALAIALREGLEATLLLGALLALAGKSAEPGARRSVHVGWVIALGAGAATWWLSGALLAHGGQRRETLEGVVQLGTAALLLAGSHWLLAQASAKRWMGFLSRHAVAGAGALGLGGLAFLSIYREAFEVVVFYRGLLLESPGRGRAVLAGAFAGLAALALVVVVFQKLGRRLKPRPLLLSCGALLCALAVVMVGEGVRALQEAGVIGLHPLDLPQLPALGVFSTGEGLWAQGLVLAGLLGSVAYALLRSREERTEASAGTAPAARS